MGFPEEAEKEAPADPNPPDAPSAEGEAVTAEATTPRNGAANPAAAGPTTPNGTTGLNAGAAEFSPGQPLQAEGLGETAQSGETVQPGETAQAEDGQEAFAEGDTSYAEYYGGELTGEGMWPPPAVNAETGEFLDPAAAAWPMQWDEATLMEWNRWLSSEASLEVDRRGKPLRFKNAQAEVPASGSGFLPDPYTSMPVGRRHIGGRRTWAHGESELRSSGLAVSGDPSEELLTLVGAWGALATRKPLQRSYMMKFKHLVIQDKPCPTELESLKCVWLEDVKQRDKERDKEKESQ